MLFNKKAFIPQLIFIFRLIMLNLVRLIEEKLREGIAREFKDINENYPLQFLEVLEEINRSDMASDKKDAAILEEGESLVLAREIGIKDVEVLKERARGILDPVLKRQGRTFEDYLSGISFSTEASWIVDLHALSYREEKIAKPKKIRKKPPSKPSVKVEKPKKKIFGIGTLDQILKLSKVYLSTYRRVNAPEYEGDVIRTKDEADKRRMLHTITLENAYVYFKDMSRELTPQQIKILKERLNVLGQKSPKKKITEKAKKPPSKSLVGVKESEDLNPELQKYFGKYHRVEDIVNMPGAFPEKILLQRIEENSLLLSTQVSNESKYKRAFLLTEDTKDIFFDLDRKEEQATPSKPSLEKITKESTSQKIKPTKKGRRNYCVFYSSLAFALLPPKEQKKALKQFTTAQDHMIKYARNFLVEESLVEKVGHSYCFDPKDTAEIADKISQQFAWVKKPSEITLMLKPPAAKFYLEKMYGIGISVGMLRKVYGDLARSRDGKQLFLKEKLDNAVEERQFVPVTIRAIGVPREVVKKHEKELGETITNGNGRIKGYSPRIAQKFQKHYRA